MKISQGIEHFFNYQRLNVKKNTLRNNEFMLRVILRLDFSVWTSLQCAWSTATGCLLDTLIHQICPNQTFIR